MMKKVMKSNTHKKKKSIFVFLDLIIIRYEWIFFSVTYICPIIILTITYTRIAIELWGQTGLFIEVLIF